MTINKSSKIYVAGHRGLVGSAIVRCLEKQGFANLLTRTHAELDLTDRVAVRAFFTAERPEFVFLAAAKVGGILANNTYPAEFIHQNLAIQTNIIHEAWRAGVERLLFLGSSCIYPRECPQPIKEEYLLTGALESTNRPYAVAKIAGIEMCWSYNRQYGARYLAVMPTNLYGPEDNFDLEKSHVLPAIIRKCHLAKLAMQGDWRAIEEEEACWGPIPADIRASLAIPKSAKDASSPATHASRDTKVGLWGTGTPRREFLYSEDLADACVFLLNLPDEKFTELLHPISSAQSPGQALPPMVNIGSGRDIPIHELAAMVKGVVGFAGKVRWDTTKPDGTPRKVLDATRLQDMGWRPRTGLREGIRLVYAQYLDACK